MAGQATLVSNKKPSTIRLFLLITIPQAQFCVRINTCAAYCPLPNQVACCTAHAYACICIHLHEYLCICISTSTHACIYASLMPCAPPHHTRRGGHLLTGGPFCCKSFGTLHWPPHIPQGWGGVGWGGGEREHHHYHPLPLGGGDGGSLWTP